MRRRWIETPGGVGGALNRYDEIYNSPEPPTQPDPVEVPRDESICGHEEDRCGRVVAAGEHVIRCGRCMAPVGWVETSTKCSCQRAGGYDEECLLMGRCSEGGPAR